MSDKVYDVVCFGAHPDDVEFGMGGTVIKLVNQGMNVLMVSFTRGEKGTYGNPQIREKEFERSAETIGCDYKLLDLIDCEFENTYENKLKVVKVIREAKPKICFSPYHTFHHDHHNGLAHPDHIRCGQMVKDALRFSRFRNILPEIPHHVVRRHYYYMLPKEIKPSFVVDIHDVRNELVKVAECHESQMAISKKGKNVLTMITHYREIMGIYTGTNMGEAFLCEEVLHAEVDDLFKF